MRHAIGLSSLFLLSAVVSAQNVADWGTVVPTEDGVQADSWTIRTDFSRASNALLFEASDPATPSAPNTSAGGSGLTNLAPGGVGIGKAAAVAVRAFRNAYPLYASGKEKTVAPGVSYADSSFASMDFGMPYIASPNGGTQLSPIGIHLEACRALAVSVPGKPVRFHGDCARGYVSLMGTKFIDIPPMTISSPNYKIRVPVDSSLPPLANIYINEQVTTDNQGRPTTDNNGNYKYDPKATSGYINIVRIVLLGPEIAETTAGHAAVIRDGKKTDVFASKLPQPPSFL